MQNFNLFLKKYKIINVGIVIAIIILSIGVYFFGKSSNLKTRVSISHVHQKTKEIDKLYTGVYIVPAIDKKYGFRKRDLPMHYLNQLGQNISLGSKENSEAQKVIKGYCKKRYEVSVGYENISELLENKEVIDNACHGRMDKLPNPQILAVNCRNTEARGDYNGEDRCYRWDTDEKMRKALLMSQMRNDNILEKINKRGRESLKTLATIFCE